MVREDDSNARRGQRRERTSALDFVIDVTVCISRRGAVEMYMTGGKVQEEEQILQIKARPGETSRGRVQAHYTSVKRPERKSDADGTAIIKDVKEGGGARIAAHSDA
ncbi:hypothetical protein JG688_00005676 [Phytophthora aleatoria]|uniref:Uncharacterized protein n=1 Tax=Phytophthora aleatoria TaxID=2496075 RepID=A0A8J5IRL0_9STRA|nr:hypothetical protein JG688_00005676 [Phytophthora aleatoria]